MGYHVVRGDEHLYEERPNVEGEAPRLTADVTGPAQKGDEELVPFIYGAPLDQAGADFFEDPGPL
jgi:hypothetical protein